MLYVNEVHSDQTGQLTLQIQHLSCHDIGYIETRSELASAERGWRLSCDDYAQAVKQFRADWEKISSVGIDAELLERAADLAEGFSLRGYGDVHLAAADRVYKGVSEFAFISFDKSLNHAAKLLGMDFPEFVPIS